MRILFISPNREEINMRTWPLGMACVAEAARQAGHDVELLDLVAEQEPSSVVKEALDGFNPHVIAMSVRNIDDQKMEGGRFLLDQVREITAICKTISEAPIILGGAGYSMFPEAALDYLGADMGIQGEGEQVFPSLLELMGRGADLSSHPGLYIAGKGLQGPRAFAKNLDDVPLPRVDLMQASGTTDQEFLLPVQTRRGCAIKCAYCSTPTIEGTRYRSRSPELVVQWLSDWAAAGFNRFFFVDNTFNLPNSYAKRLCSSIIDAGLGITWRAILYPKQLDKELAGLMASAGCSELSFGFESGDENILHVLNKHFTPEDIRRTAAIVGDAGISRTGFLMLGAPGETRKTVETSIEFVDSLNLEAMKITLGIRIYPYTRLAETAVEQGVIDPEDNLLFPRFYLAAGLEEWLPEFVTKLMSQRPNWFS